MKSTTFYALITFVVAICAAANPGYICFKNCRCGYRGVICSSLPDWSTDSPGLQHLTEHMEVYVHGMDCKVAAEKLVDDILNHVKGSVKLLVLDSLELFISI